MGLEAVGFAAAVNRVSDLSCTGVRIPLAPIVLTDYERLSLMAV